MTHVQKSLLYDFLKTASDSFYSISSPAFPREKPNLLDDEEQKIEQGALSIAQNAQQQEKMQPEPNENRSVEEKLLSIAQKIDSCSRCRLCKTRNKTVLGEGVKNPLVLVVGEGPGAEEDATGRPFVGAAGQLLDKMLGAIGLSRSKNCYISNIVKCRPPQNRTPFLDEAEACRSFLDAQIAILKPKAILAAGSTALKNLLKTSNGVVKLHGQILSLNGIPLLATYHPSALLRFPENKRTAWEDLKIFREKLREIEPQYENAEA